MKISAAMLPLAGASMQQLHFGSGAGFRASMRIRRGNSACCAHQILSRAGLCYTGSWNSWIRQSQLDCSMLLARARHTSNRRYKGVVSSSLLGVGAPEVLVIAVVALLVFGPKGLAEVARSLGQSLRAFKPAIQELQEVSKEFKQTLEKEIGLDELRVTSQKPVEPSKAAPVDDNFVIDEITAQLNRLQEEKAEQADAAAETTSDDTSTVAVGSSSGDDETPSSATTEIPDKEKEMTSVNNVAKE